MGRERPRPLWREPVLIAAVVVLGVAGVAIGVIVLAQLAPPVMFAPVDAAGVPVAMPHGADLPEVPPVLAGAFDRPVVLAGSLDVEPGEIEGCGDLEEWEFAPTMRAAVTTPEGLTVSIRGEEQGTEALLQLTCFAFWGGRSWTTWASWTAEAADTMAPLGPEEPICCRHDDLALEGGEEQAPAGSAWLVQDRGVYWLAYPVLDGGLVHPVWPVEGDADDPPRPPSVYLDAQGQRLAQGDEPAQGQESP